jgi:hypothetical protein
MASETQLLAEAEALRSREAEVKKRLRQLVEDSATACSSVRPWFREVALKVFALANQDPSAALLFLSMKKQTSSEAEVLSWFDTLSSAKRLRS